MKSEIEGATPSQKVRVPMIFAAQEPMIKNGSGNWIPNPSFDLSDLKRFGNLFYVWSPGAANFAPAHLRERALQIAATFDEDNDCLVNLGSPTLIATLAWAIGKCGKTLRVLEWDRRSSQYILTTEQTQ
jgi:hypothetical protein